MACHKLALCGLFIELKHTGGGTCSGQREKAAEEVEVEDKGRFLKTESTCRPICEVWRNGRKFYSCKQNAFAKWSAFGAENIP